jgi:hypothetical protein
MPPAIAPLRLGLHIEGAKPRLSALACWSANTLDGRFQNAATDRWIGGGEVRLYVDGRRVSREPREGDFSNRDATLRFVLANEATLDRQWPGLIEYVAVHNLAPNGEAVRQCFRSRTPR